MHSMLSKSESDAIFIKINSVYSTHKHGIIYRVNGYTWTAVDGAFCTHSLAIISSVTGDISSAYDGIIWNLYEKII